MSEKTLLWQHLQVLEDLQKQRLDEKDVLSRVHEDTQRLREIRQAKKVIEKSEQMIRKKSKKLTELENQLEKSRRFLQKLMEIEKLEEFKNE